MTGGIIIGLPLSIAAYLIALTAIEKYHRKKTLDAQVPRPAGNLK